jgi:hypothetical protein
MMLTSLSTLRMFPLSAFRRSLAVFVLVTALVVLPPRRAKAESLVDSKVMYYFEGGDRISVISPTVTLQQELESGLTIKIEGIYNAISGATPTGAPPRAKTTTTRATPVSSVGGSGGGGSGGGSPVGDDGDDDDEREFESVGVRASGGLAPGYYSALSAATPAPAPSPPPVSGAGGGGGGGGGGSATTTTEGGSEVPTSDFSDERIGVSLSLSKRLGSHTPSLQLSYSDENDYLSLGIGLLDSVDFNKKNTTFTYGGAYTYDTLEPANGQPNGTKRTIDGMVGLTQVLTPTTLFTLNLAAGRAEGLLTDPYKVVELNGVLVPEKRPDSKTKTIGYLALNQFVTPLDGAVELSFRHYTDSFGINAETLGLTWFQKIGNRFVLSPRVRYYDQTEADFYAVTFSGSPEYYSADYRVSALTAISYGLKAIWTPNSRCSFDLEYGRYDQKGSDGVTSQDAYPQATLILAGVRIWL